MRRIGIFAIIIGTGIILLWGFLLAAGGVPEIRTAPVSITFHLIAELLMGTASLTSGILILQGIPAGTYTYLITSGMIIYSVINSSGYYGDTGEWVMVAMFMVILISTLVTDTMLLNRIFQAGKDR